MKLLSEYFKRRKLKQEITQYIEELKTKKREVDIRDPLAKALWNYRVFAYIIDLNWDCPNCGVTLKNAVYKDVDRGGGFFAKCQDCGKEYEFTVCFKCKGLSTYFSYSRGIYCDRCGTLFLTPGSDGPINFGMQLGSPAITELQQYEALRQKCKDLAGPAKIVPVFLGNTRIKKGNR